MNVPSSPIRFLLYTGLLFFLISCDNNNTENLESFQVHPDFELNLVASEPLVFDPVDLAFDEKGRAFVLEMPGYPDHETQSRIVLLHDRDKDGKFDHRTVFADNLRLASSLMPYREGFLVAAPPHLFYIKDTDGDDHADLKEIKISGFSEGNLQHNFNGLTYGIDNWVYAANGGNSGEMHWPDHEENAIPLREQDFRFRLEEGEMERVGASSGGFELAMDDWGNIFETHNMEHISHLVFPGKYIEGLPVNPKHSLDNISQHEKEGLARIYPIGLQETRVNHPEQAGYFSGSCGITHYGGGVFPDEFQGNIFVADVVLNLIHRDVISSNGAALTASRGREKTEFLASSDRSFRPVNMTVGPDGALYIMDMHREVIEHPEWIPDELEVNMDLNAGKEAGRIYQILPKGGIESNVPIFDKKNLSSVVGYLAHSNQWWRNTAQRLLVEWSDPNAVEPLISLFHESKNPLARLHALRTLEGLDALNESLIIEGLKDQHPGVRRHAIMMAESKLNQSDPLLSEILLLANDSDARVRMQMALSLSTVSLSDKTSESVEKIRNAQLTIAKKDMGDTWIRMAVISSVQQDPIGFLMAVQAANLFEQIPQTQSLIPSLAELIGETQTPQKLYALLQQFQSTKDTKIPTELCNGLAAGWEKRPLDRRFNSVALKPMASQLSNWDTSSDLSLMQASWQFRKSLGIKPPSTQQEVLKKAKLIALDSKEDPENRIQYLKLLSFADFDKKEDALFQLLGTNEPKAIQIEAARQISQEQKLSVAQKVLDRWQSLGPEVRNMVGDMLLYRQENHDLLLTALETGAIQLGELNFHLERRRTLLFDENENTRKRAEALFSDAGIVKRKEAIEQMRPALSLKGNPDQGHKLFTATCSTCHKLGNEGKEIGPDLSEIYRKSGETLLHEILDPNAGVDTKYVNHTLKTHEGEILAGIVANETDTEITLRQMNGEDRTVPRHQIASFQSSGLSLMPEGLESGMSTQEMADLLAFLQSPK